MITLSHQDLVIAARVLRPTLGGSSIDMVDGREWIVFDSEVPAPGDAVVVEAVLSGVKAMCKADIDNAAEQARQAFLTPGAGQAMEYEAVASEADKLQTDEAPVDANYPMLKAAVGLDIDPGTSQLSTDLAGAARAVLAARASWTRVGATIRNIRLKAKNAIDAAETPEVARAVLASVTWPAP